MLFSGRCVGLVSNETVWEIGEEDVARGVKEACLCRRNGVPERGMRCRAVHHCASGTLQEGKGVVMCRAGRCNGLTRK